MTVNIQIRPFHDDDMAAIVELSLLAWEPVFQSFEQVLGSRIYARIYPDWRTRQREDVEAVCKDREKTSVRVAEADGKVVGFIAWHLHAADAAQTGEVVLLAVHPAYQNQGIGTDLNTLALAQMQAAGMQLVAVGTGGDPGHAPARRAYEKAGYTAMPQVRYYKAL
jgi:predicted N-acetyltransferase YhbS